MTQPDALQERALRAIDSEKADALAKAFCLLDSFAGDGLGHVYGNGQTIDADDTVLELCSAFDCDPEPGWWRELAYEMLDTLSTPTAQPPAAETRLRRALAPFAAIKMGDDADCLTEIVPNGYSDPMEWRNHIRQARTALTQPEPTAQQATDEGEALQSIRRVLVGIEGNPKGDVLDREAAAVAMKLIDAIGKAG